MNFLAQTILPSFLVPGLAIAGAAAMAVPIIIHILSKRPRKPEPWAAMKFLLAAYKKHRIRTRMEQWLLLAVRCLLLLLLGLALAGPAWSALGSLTGLQPRGRTVIVIFDHSLTSGAHDAAGKTRLDALKSTAGKLLDSLTTGDRVALITAARPAAALVAPPTADPALIRRQIEQLSASPSSADLSGALRLALKTVEQAEDANRPTYVALLSDFSAGAVPQESASATLSSELAALGERATLLMTKPAMAQANTQIAALDPDRRVVVADTAGATPTVTWTMKLRRFAPILGDGELSTVRLTVAGGTPVRESIRWKEGQAEAEVRVTTPLARPDASPQAGANRAATGLLTVEAVMEPGAEGTDALSIDNTRHALVRVRQKLVVMLLDRRTEEAAKEYTPRRWVSTVLAPVADRLGWPIEIRQQDAGAIDPQMLRDVDALLVLRGDLLDDGAWQAIKRWTESGGLAWFMPPAADTPTIWPQKLTDTFGLPWVISLEAREHKPPLRLAIDTPAVAEFARLRADLGDLMRPVEILKRLPIDPASVGGETDVLLRGEAGEPLFLGAQPASGDGRVLLLATAVDAAWTNLPTKPLFVPLMHESLRAAIDRLQPSRVFEPGDQPTLGGGFRSATRLVAPGGGDVLLVAQNAEGAARPAGAAPSGVTPIRPLIEPGVYRTETDALAVEVKPAAANTLAADPAILRAYLAPAGAWLTIDSADPAAALASPSLAADYGWHLLWAVLALALVETFLARHVSHAGSEDRTAGVTAVTRAA